MKLRPLQTAAIDGLRKCVAEGHSRVLLVAPTGFGKTIVIVAIALGHLKLVAGSRVLVVVHRRELVRQTADALRSADLDSVGVLQADTDTAEGARVVVASVQTLVARGVRPTASMVVWDEAHHIQAATFREVFASYPDALHVGATATPMRADERPLGDMFTAMVVGASVRELTAAGWLVPSEVLAPGDLRKELSMYPVEAYRTHTPGRAAVVFAASVAHARLLASEFNEAGIRAACVDGETDADVRDDVLRRFADGSLDVVTNCFVLTEGWDCPRADVCILARTPEHVGTYLQMVGRVLRTSAGKTIATVIDLRGAVHACGLPDEERKWSLSGKACLRVETMTALRRCRECLAIFRPRRTCPRCGAAHEVIEKIPRVLKRAEKLERMNDVPQEERDRRWLWALVARLKRTPKYAGAPDEKVQRVARFLFQKKKGRVAA